MICKKCKKDLPENKFSIVTSNSTYIKKDGTVSHYHASGRRKICNACTWRKAVSNMAYRDYKLSAY